MARRPCELGLTLGWLEVVELTRFGPYGSVATRGNRTTTADAAKSTVFFSLPPCAGRPRRARFGVVDVVKLLEVQPPRTGPARRTGFRVGAEAGLPSMR